MFSATRPRPSPASPASSDLTSLLRRFSEAVDGRLSDLLPVASESGETLVSAMRAAVLSPGKRMRPALVLLVVHAFGRETESAVDVACVPELVHAASLVLDDLPCMDDAALRRGHPALHRQFGEAVAILAAFALLARAQALLPTALAAAGVAPAHRAGLQQDFAAVVGALCRGQEADLRLAGAAADLSALERIHAQKTGALFEYAALLGSVVAGVRGAVLEAVLAFARNLGLAFQVSDDILDARGEGGRLGKATGRDAALGRTTFVSVFGVAGSETLRDELIATARQALAPLGAHAQHLNELAEYVRTRLS